MVQKPSRSIPLATQEALGYVPESKSFLIDGNFIEEKHFEKKTVAEMKKKAKTLKLLTETDPLSGETMSEGKE